MAVTYANYAQFTAVYSLKGISQDDINNYWLPYGALRLNESLGGYFTTPFSSNNHTARDLSIHMSYLGILNRSRTGSTEEQLIRTSITQRITDICCGNMPMITDSGESLFADSTTRADAWSTTQNYQSTFNMLDALNQRIDPDWIDDIEDSL